MEPTDVNRVVLVLSAVVTSVGVIDAAAGGDVDLLVVLALSLLLQAVLLARLQGRRPAVPLRADLVAWLRTRAAEDGEPLGAVADRCVAACRADLDRA